MSINLTSPSEMMRDLAQRAKRRRLDANLTQDGLAKRAQVSLGTLKQFERTGKASLGAVILIAFALGAEREFEALFAPLSPRSIDDVVSTRPRRQRGRRA
jgi:transcriptional regulator with XRE-family HTH domain